MGQQAHQHPGRAAEVLPRRPGEDPGEAQGGVLSDDGAARATRSPFPGLRPFGDSDADGELFAGRDAEIDLVAANLAAARLTILYGPSGVGKSSLLHAGVAGLIRARAAAASAAGTPAPTIVVHDEWAGDPGLQLAGRIAQDAGIDPAGLALDEAIARWGQERRGVLLLIFDQFEEYLRLHPEPADDSLDELLPEIVERADLRVHVLLSLRDDALAELDRFEGRVPSLFDNYLRLPRMTSAAARQAIEQPLARVNEWRAAAGAATVGLDDGLVDEVVGQLADPQLSATGEHRLATADGAADTVEPAFLQLVMQALWAADSARDPPRLRGATLLELGGAAAIVRAHLDGAMDSLTAGQRDVAATIFTFLAMPSGAKIRYTADDLAKTAQRPAADVAGVLTALSRPELRIIRRVPSPTGDPDGQGFEIFHDVLAGAVRGWAQRARARRLERNNRRLAAAVAALLAILVGALAGGADTGVLKRLELRSVDLRYALGGGHDPDPKLVVVAIDDRMPETTRRDDAKVLDAVAAGKPAVIVDTNEYEAGPEDTTGTAQLMNAVRRTRGGVLLATSRIDLAGNTTLFGSKKPHRTFARAPARYAGLPYDEDRSFRRLIFEGVQSVSGVESGTPLRALSVEAAMRAGAPVDKADLPTWIDFAGGPGTYPHHSFVDVEQGKVAPATFRDKIVVIGDVSTAARSGGYRTTADRTHLMTPTEVQANAIATLRAGLPLRDAPGAVTVALIVLLAMLASALAMRLTVPRALALSAGAGLLLLVAAQLAFGAGRVVGVVAPLLALAVAAAANPLATQAARLGRRAARALRRA